MQTTTHDLWVDGQSIEITTGSISTTIPETTTSGSLTLTWTIPNNPVAYDGAVVLLSESPFTIEEQPVDGTRYSASTNWASPADTIVNAVVVAAFYGFFGDSISETSVTVTGLDPSKIYYASIHAASNILQYYTLGSKSYPLEANTSIKKNSSFAGSIPRSSDPPENPTDGQVYFDLSSNTVLMWTDIQSAWIKVNQQTVPIGITPSISTGQIFYNTSDSALKFFDGTEWIEATSSNLRVKMGAAWAPFTQITVTSSYPESPTVGDFIYKTNTQATSAPATFTIKFYSLGQWLNISSNVSNPK